MSNNMRTILIWFLLISVLIKSRAEEENVERIVPPIIDFSRLTYDMTSIPYDLFLQIEDALTNHGVFVAVNHSLWPSQQAAAFHSANRLFNLPLEKKQALQFNETNHFGRGYLSFGAESGLSANFEPKEGYSFGHPRHEPNRPHRTWLQSANIWPSEWTSTEIQPLNSIYNQFSGLAEQFLSYVMYARKRFRDKPTNIMIAGGSEISVLRLFHYFPVESEIVQKALASDQSERSRDRIMGSSPHTDWGLLTIILQNSVTGLQYRKNNAWIDVPYIAGSLIFNCGDYFSIVTNGDYHAPVHRVLSPQSKERLSFVYFFYPHYDSPLTWGKVKNAPAAEVNIAVDGMTNVPKEKGKSPVDDSMEYNTLSVLNYEDIEVTEYDKQNTEKFGDYILKKWRGVYRG